MDWEHAAIAVVSFVTGGGLLKLLSWLRKPHERQEAEMMKERKELLKEREKYIDALEHQLGEYIEEREQFIASLEAKISKLETLLDKKKEENTQLFVAKMRRDVEFEQLHRELDEARKQLVGMKP